MSRKEMVPFLRGLTLIECSLSNTADNDFSGDKIDCWHLIEKKGVLLIC